MKIEIRLANEADFDQIYTIWLDGLSNSFKTKSLNKDSLFKIFSSNFIKRNGIYNYWVITNPDAKILGWQSLIPWSNHPIHENLFAESSTYIAKDTQNKGLGKLLLEHAIKAAEKSSLLYIIGFIAKNNYSSIKLVKDIGFSIWNDFPLALKETNLPDKILVVKPIKPYLDNQ